MNRGSFKILIALYFALYMCLLIPGHLATFAAEFDSVCHDQAESLHDHDHDPQHCTICLTGGQVAAITVDYPQVGGATAGFCNPGEAVSGIAFAADLSTDPRAPPVMV